MGGAQSVYFSLTGQKALTIDYYKRYGLRLQGDLGKKLGTPKNTGFLPGGTKKGSG